MAKLSGREFEYLSMLRLQELLGFLGDRDL